MEKLIKRHICAFLTSYSIDEVKEMKFEVKVIVMSLVYSIVFMLFFTYIASYGQKTVYVYQVGIYKEEKNKDNKIRELQEDGFTGYFYIKEGQYYVLSMISENYDDITSHSQQVKGIIKKYIVSKNLTKEQLLEYLSKGEQND